MQIKQLNENISAIHCDVTTHPLFEGLWPIPRGVTLNSYLLRSDGKTALIDLTADWAEAVAQFTEQLSQAAPRVDYLILNHLEPDHTGHLAEFVKANPGVEVIATQKGAKLVKDFLKTGGSFALREAKDGDTLDVGSLKLSFHETPNVHWPETMCSFEETSGTLFSCDAFGGYGATGARIFDDEFTDDERALFADESLRYYATIVAPFSAFVKKAIEKLGCLGVKAVAPSHGIVWRTNPGEIIKQYARFASYNTDMKCEREICVICASMYGATRRGAEAVARGIKREDSSIKVDFIEIPETDDSVALAAALRSSGVVMAAPTYEYKLFPAAAHLMDLFARKRVTGKKALRVGSYGWSGGAQREYDALAQPLKWTSVEPFEWQGFPSAADIQAAEEKGAELARMVAAGAGA